ncbi:MAG: potassium transporter Kup [Alphaproteobacteria bacterium]
MAEAEFRSKKGNLTGTLILGALGVVYGDIGTSPLYALKLVLLGLGENAALKPEYLLGSLSLIFWSLTITVTIKYVMLIMRADNNGEGGVLALGTLASRGLRKTSRMRAFFTALAILGFALFVGDSLITPAISVLSAVEGLKTATVAFDHYIVPITLIILVGLFMIQSHGTHRIGAWFGPIMILWFSTIGFLGAFQIMRESSVLEAIDPSYAINMALREPGKVFAVMGFVFLAVTGGEALYADMGHFCARPIRMAWFWIVFPALVLNYFGQGALLMQHPEVLDSIFFEMAPPWALYPLIGLSALATIIASQAVISGLFTVTQQAVSLGFLPRMRIRHTSAREIGQVYVSRMNWLAMLGVVALVLGFRSSDNLGHAYGVAVTGLMMVTTIIAGFVAVSLWRWPVIISVAVFGSLLLVDTVFFASTMLKIFDGGWFPIGIAFILCSIVMVWRHGRGVLYDALYKKVLSSREFITSLNENVPRVPGTAIFMTANVERVPKAMLHNLRHNRVLHERIIFMRVKVLDVPWVSIGDRLELEDLGRNFYTVVAKYGFMDQPDVPQALALLALDGWDIDLKAVSYFLSRETLIASHVPTMGPIEEQLFIALSTAAENATHYFRIPPEQVLELGTQIEI